MLNSTSSTSRTTENWAEAYGREGELETDYSDAPLFENDDHQRYLASLGQPRRAGKPKLRVVEAPRIDVTFFPTEMAKSMRVEAMTLLELRDKIHNQTGRSKGELPWLKLAKFSGERTEANCLRFNDAVTAITGIELDYDAKQMKLDEAIAIAKKAKLRGVIYTSASYTDEAPKWRILLPTSKSLPPDERAKLVARVNGLFGGVFSPESFTLSQSYYFGAVNKNPAHRAVVVEGDCIDLRGDLDAGALDKKGEKTASPNYAEQYGNEQTYKKPPREKVEYGLSLLGDPGNYVTWISVGQEIKSWDKTEVGWKVYDSWVEGWVSARGLTYNRDVSRKRWNGFSATQTNIGGLFNRVTAKAGEGWWPQAQAEGKIGDAEDAKGEKKEPPVLVSLSLGDLRKRQVEPLQWIVKDFVLANALNGLYGDGGVGKDLVLLQLAMAMVCNVPWLGQEVAQGRVLYFPVEDSIAELRRREDRITSYYETFDTYAPRPDDLRIVPMLGENTVIAVFDHGKGVVKSTPLFASMCKIIEEFKPSLVVTGNRVNIFSVNQNEDLQARQCLNLLNQIIVKYDTAVLMPSHVSVAGGQSGEGTSGSVQWSNGVRLRTYLSRIKGDKDEPEPDPDARTLEVKKANWSRTGVILGLVYRDGTFVRDPTTINTPVEGETARDAEIRNQKAVEQEFLRMLDKATEKETKVSPQPTARNYAPTLFSRDSMCKYRGKVGKVLLQEAMDRLFERKAIRSVQYGSPSDETYRIVRVGLKLVD